MATIRALFDAVDRNTKQVSGAFTLHCQVCYLQDTCISYKVLNLYVDLVDNTKIIITVISLLSDYDIKKFNMLYSR